MGELGNAATNVAFPLVMMITTLAMTMLILSGFTIGIISFVFINPILTAFGGRGQTLEYATQFYGHPLKKDINGRK